MFYKYVRINYIDSETQEHKVLNVRYVVEAVLKKFIAKNCLIVKDQFDISRYEYQQAPKANKVDIQNGNEKLPGKQQGEPTKSPGFLKRLFKL